MLTAKIYIEEQEINQRLLPFGITRSELIEVVRSTLAERSSVVAVDVLSAAGQLAYIHGQRHLRFLLLNKGYKINREKNVESNLNRDTGIKISYQNVDMAAVEHRIPKAISGKKSGSAKIIQEAQGVLFPNDQLPEAIDTSKLKNLNIAMWYLCVSFDENNVRAELSLPATVKNGNFSGFLERIFIIDTNDWASSTLDNSDTNTDTADFEPNIIRKQSND